MRPLTVHRDDRPLVTAREAVMAGGRAEPHLAPCRPDPETREPRLDLRPPLKLDNLRPVGDTAALARLVQATDEALARYEARQARIAQQTATPNGRRLVAAPVLAPMPGSASRRRWPAWLRRTVQTAVATLLLAVAAGGVYAQRQGLVERWTGDARGLLASLVGRSGLTLREIELVGRRNAPAEAVRAALGATPGDAMLAVDLVAMRDRLLALGWVKRATVERILPDRLRVEIVERVPFARWQHQGRIELIDFAGTVLETGAAAPPAGLRRVVGAGAADKAADLFRQLEAEPSLFRRVTDMVSVRERRWDVRFDNGVKVKLPEDGLELAWARLAALQADNRVLDKDVAVIDMRVPDRLFVRLTPEAIAARQPPDVKKPAARRS